MEQGYDNPPPQHPVFSGGSRPRGYPAGVLPPHVTHPVVRPASPQGPYSEPEPAIADEPTPEAALSPGRNRYPASIRALIGGAPDAQAMAADPSGVGENTTHPPPVFAQAGDGPHPGEDWASPPRDLPANRAPVPAPRPGPMASRHADPAGDEPVRGFFGTLADGVVLFIKSPVLLAGALVPGRPAPPEAEPVEPVSYPQSIWSTPPMPPREAGPSSVPTRPGPSEQAPPAPRENTAPPVGSILPPEVIPAKRPAGATTGDVPVDWDLEPDLAVEDVLAPEAMFDDDDFALPPASYGYRTDTRASNAQPLQAGERASGGGLRRALVAMIGSVITAVRWTPRVLYWSTIGLLLLPFRGLFWVGKQTVGVFKEAAEVSHGPGQSKARETQARADAPSVLPSAASENPSSEARAIDCSAEALAQIIDEAEADDRETEAPPVSGSDEAAVAHDQAGHRAELAPDGLDAGRPADEAPNPPFRLTAPTGPDLPAIAPRPLDPAPTTDDQPRLFDDLPAPRPTTPKLPSVMPKPTPAPTARQQKKASVWRVQESPRAGGFSPPSARRRPRPPLDPAPSSTIDFLTTQDNSAARQRGEQWASDTFANGLNPLLYMVIGSTTLFLGGFLLTLIERGSVVMLGILLMIAGVGLSLVSIMLLNEWLFGLRFQSAGPSRFLLRVMGFAAAACLLTAFAAVTIPREFWPIGAA